MLILLYVVLAIYLLTFSVTFFLYRHSRQGQRIAGVRPLMIAAAILLLGLAIAKATFSFIGAAYLFFALLVAAPLFAFGLGRLLATALTWLRRFRVVFALVVFLAASAPIASVAFLEYIRFQHHQALQAKLLAFQLGNLKVTFDNRKIVLPVNPRLALFPTCFDRHSSLKEGCRFSGHGEAATEPDSSSPDQPSHKLQYVHIKPLSRFSKCEATNNHDCLETSNPRLWCERRSDSLAKAWCELMPDYQLKFEYRESGHENIWGWQGVDKSALARQIKNEDREKLSLQCNEKAKSYCKFLYKLTDSVLVSAYFQRIDRNNSPRLAEDAISRAHRIWNLMTDPESN
ncbi:hypothetical protein [Roseibium sp.]|uniref:hypothetical protein n=2 Tax=Roseibium sp. TaxID=1936156 RepID=UPI0039EE9E3B